MVEYKGILIGGEVVGGKVATTTKELLSTGRGLGDDLNQPVTVLVVGKDIQDAARELILLGADRVITADGPAFAEAQPELYTALFAAACGEINPSVVMLGQDDMGRDVAPRLAAKLQACVTMDCVKLSVDPESGSLLRTRPVFGGKAMAVWASRSGGPQVITMRPRAAAPAEPDASRKGEISALAVEIDAAAAQSELVEVIEEELKGIKLEEAGIVVSGGGGIGGSEGFKLLEELAGLLGGAVGSTRVPCDEGWAPKTMEIGQTGRVVGPDLYIAVGISGAPQHLAGCSQSRRIIAVNKDPDAPIFKAADFGVVGDYKKVLPAFIEKCRELLDSIVYNL